ncbi:MAG: hypothetical protein PHO48_04630 [Candidatus Gracilibacteria bacterium]|nr:hypothetical protein [Candidatus Gracilibacteria bacterium]
MARHNNVEQVGFINTNPGEAELIMAGGEFCGNAARSTAWRILNGNTGELKIKVSGVSRSLRAGVTPDGMAWAEMPIDTDPNMIQELEKGMHQVSMDGITHLVVFAAPPTQDSEAIKKIARSLLEEKGLTSETAAGVMYVEFDQEKEKYKLEPIVFVRDVNTLYYESACGSGTTALGLVLAKKQGTAINEVAILQPSGQDIFVSVEYDGKKFGFASIKGAVQELGRGEI